MAQFRLTAKMAKELNVSELIMPESVTRLYDDWYVDLTRIGRKKVYLFMHITMRIALALPSFEIGGKHNLFPCFALQLQYILKEFDCHNYHHIADEAQAFFNEPYENFVFTKTNDKSSIRYMADFIYMLNFDTEKYALKNPSDGSINQIICDKLSLYWLTYLIKDPLNPKSYIYPKDLMKRILG